MEGILPPAFEFAEANRPKLEKILGLADRLSATVRPNYRALLNDDGELAVVAYDQVVSPNQPAVPNIDLLEPDPEPTEPEEKARLDQAKTSLISFLARAYMTQAAMMEIDGRLNMDEETLAALARERFSFPLTHCQEARESVHAFVDERTAMAYEIHRTVLKADGLKPDQAIDAESVSIEKNDTYITELLQVDRFNDLLTTAQTIAPVHDELLASLETLTGYGSENFNARLYQACFWAMTGRSQSDEDLWEIAELTTEPTVEIRQFIADVKERRRAVIESRNLVANDHVPTVGQLDESIAFLELVTATT